MNIKKLFAALAGVSLFAQTVVPSAGVFGAEYSQELQDAYNWAYSKSITTMSPIDNANMYGAITRAELAKMLANWAKDGGATPDTSKSCTFTDTASVGGDLAVAIVESCQLGLMGQGITEFRPYATISRAEFGTALSRALWGDKYEGGNPYYVNHLNALQAAGIMKQIANAESTKEVRGYVMLMLMRADEGAAEKADCSDPVVKAACLLDSDACPAECKESSEKEDTVVKSGDLAVTAESAPTTKILKSGTSDLDTLTFKTSENVEINKITLERYGYSKEDQILGIWLEDQDGNIIADSKTLSKDKVTLNLKKNYRAVDGVLEATVVVSTSGADGTIGFKVTDVESTAKNLNVDNYKPYTYEVIGYDASEVTLELKGSDKNYNYEEGKSYEIARLKVKAGNADMIVKGFTLTNAGKVDMKESLDELTIKVDSEKVSAKYSVNKDDELVVTFSEDVEILMNKNKTFVLEASFKDFDDYGESVEYYINDAASDFNAVESKNNSRVQVINAAGKTSSHTVYTFNGGKIKLSNKKLGNVDAAQGSEGIVVAEGEISITEPISKLTFSINAKNDGAKYIKNMYFVVNGDEYDATSVTKDSSGFNSCGTSGCDFEFKNVSIDKSGKIQFKIDVMDPTNGISGSPVIDFSESFNGSKLTGSKYDNVSKQYVKASDVAGSISFSKVTIQAAKAALENNLTKDVEFIRNETSRKVVFDGTYTAKKGGDIDLNKFFIQSANTYTNVGSNINKVTFYLFVDGEEVADTDVINTGSDLDKVSMESFSDIRVKAGESVKVKVEAEVEAYGNADTLPTFRLYILGTDMSGNENTGKGDENLKTMKVKEKGSVTIPSTSTDKTALLKAQNIVLAEFTVKPSNNNEGITLEELAFTVTKTYSGTVTTFTGDDNIRVKVGGIEADFSGQAIADIAASGIKSGDLQFTANEEIPSAGVKVQIIYKNDEAGEFAVELHSVNSKKFSNTYSKYLVPSVVKFVKQDEQTSGSEYEVAVSHDDDANSIGRFTMFKSCTGTNGAPADWTATNDATVAYTTSSLNDADTFTIYRTDTVQTICAIYYEVSGDFTGSPFAVKLTKNDYKDFFKASNGKELAIPRS